MTGIVAKISDRQERVFGPNFSIPAWVVIFAAAPTGMLVGAVWFVEGDVAVAEFIAVTMAGTLVRYLTIAAFVGISVVVAPTTRPDDRSERLTSTYVGHAVMGARDIVVGIIVLVSHKLGVLSFSSSLIDPFLFAGAYVSFRLLVNFGWAPRLAVLATAAMWMGDIAGRILFALLFSI